MLQPKREEDATLSSVAVPCEAFQRADQEWARIENVLKGSDAVKAAGTDHLPALAGHSNRPDLAAAYIQRALFVNFSARTVEALVGAVFRKEGGIKVPRQYEPRLANFNNLGDQLYGFAKKVVREVISYGRYGLLVDIPPGTKVTKSIDFLPHVAGYSARSIINWRTRNIGGTLALDQVILLEHRLEPQMFGSVSRPYYRVLELDDKGWYRIRIIENFDGKWFISSEDYPKDPTKRMLDYIPFVFVSPVDLSPDITRSPIIDLVDANLSHYRTYAELEQGRFYTSQPTPVILGVSEDQQHAYGQLTIGAGNVLLMPPSVSDVKMLEFRGDGLGSLERGLAEKVEYMAQLGAGLLAPPKLSAEAAETVRLRNTGETSTLASIARTCADAIKRTIEFSCKWAKIGREEGPIEFELNQDFIDSTMQPQMVSELVGALLSGAIPLEVFYFNLKRDEMVPPGSTFESFRDALEMEGPKFARPINLVASNEDEPEADEADEADEAERPDDGA